MRAAELSFIGTMNELKERINLIRALREYSDEVVILYFETNDFEYSLNKVKDMYEEYKEKSHSQAYHNTENDQ